MTYEALKLRDGELLDVMLATRKHNFTTMIHAENGEVVEWMTKKLEEKGMTEPYHHYTSRPPIVEAEATNRAISLSEIIQIPILLVHVSAPVTLFDRCSADNSLRLNIFVTHRLVVCQFMGRLVLSTCISLPAI
jgi:dihydroorotase-like cyclic amidohydrolase